MFLYWCMLCIGTVDSALTMYTEGHGFKPLLGISVRILHYYRSLNFRRRSREKLWSLYLSGLLTITNIIPIPLLVEKIKRGRGKKKEMNHSFKMSIWNLFLFLSFFHLLNWRKRKTWRSKLRKNFLTISGLGKKNFHNFRTLKKNNFWQFLNLEKNHIKNFWT